MYKILVMITELRTEHAWNAQKVRSKYTSDMNYPASRVSPQQTKKNIEIIIKFQIQITRSKKQNSIEQR